MFSVKRKITITLEIYIVPLVKLSAAHYSVIIGRLEKRISLQNVFLKDVMLVTDHSDAGRLFNSMGLAADKACSASLVSVRGTEKSALTVKHNDHCEEPLATSETA